MEKLIFILSVLTVKLLIKGNKMIYWKFKLYIKQSYCIVWSVKKIQRGKTCGLQRQIRED